MRSTACSRANSASSRRSAPISTSSPTSSPTRRSTLPFAFVAPFGPWSVGLVIVASCVSEMAGALGPMVGAARRFDGPMGKSDRALVFGALGLYVGLGGALARRRVLADAGARTADRLQRRAPRPAWRGRGDEGRAMNDRFTPPLTARRSAYAHRHRAHVRDARRRRAVLSPLAGDGGARRAARS